VIAKRTPLRTTRTAIPPSCADAHAQIGELRLLRWRKDRLDLRVGRVELVGEAVGYAIGRSGRRRLLRRERILFAIGTSR